MYKGDEIILDELKEVLKQIKNKKAAGPDEITVELIKYGGLMLELRMLQLLNQCCKREEIPTT